MLSQQTDLWIPHRKQHTRRTVFNHRPHLSSYMQKRQVDGRERREAEEELEVQEEKINKIKLEEYVGSKKLDESLWIHRRAMA